MKNPELDLITQLTQVREALTQEREALIARVAVIDDALGTPAAATKPTKRTPKTAAASKPGGLKESILTAVEGTPGLTIKEIQLLVSEGSPKSVEAIVHGLASEGRLTKDGSTPRKFSMPKAVKSSGAAA
jgi:hypothetical protein